MPFVILQATIHPDVLSFSQSCLRGDFLNIATLAMSGGASKLDVVTQIPLPLEIAQKLQTYIIVFHIYLPLA